MLVGIMRPGRRAHRLTSLALALALLAAPVLAADDASIQRQQRPGKIQRSVAQRLFDSLRKAVDATVAKLNAGDSVRVKVPMFLIDDSNRIFCDLVADATFDVPAGSEKVQKKVLESKGYHMATNGSLAVDVSFLETQKVAEGRVRVKVQLDITIVVDQFFHDLTRFAASIAGAVTAGLLAERVVDLLGGVQAQPLGEAVTAATKSLGKLVAGQTGGEAHDLIDRWDRGRDATAAATSYFRDVTPGGVIRHFGAFILHTGVRLGAKLTGLTLGAAIGTILFPATGGAIGAIVGAAALVILGNIIVDKVTQDWPVRWRLWRIRRMAAKLQVRPGDEDAPRWREAMARHEEKLAAKVIGPMDRDRYDTLDELLDELRGSTPRERECYQGLIARIKERLQFSVVQENNFVAARKYWQLMEAIGQAPPGTAEASGATPAPAR